MNTGRNSDQFVLRLPDGMRDEIKADALMNNRSMTAEIVARLQARGSVGAEAIEFRMECLRLAAVTRGTTKEILQTAKSFLDFVSGNQQNDD